MELSRNLRIETVARLGLSVAHTLEPTATVAQAVQLMRQARVGCVLVTRERVLVGVFTERDLMTRILATGRDPGLALAEFMTPTPTSVDLNQPIREAILRLQAGGFRHLPVVDPQQRPVGMISAKRVIEWVVAHFPQLVYNLPPDPSHHAPRTAEGA